MLNKLLAERQRVLDAIPECNLHGSCVPHALDWIESTKNLLADIMKIAKFDDWDKCSTGRQLVFNDMAKLIGRKEAEEAL